LYSCGLSVENYAKSLTIKGKKQVLDNRFSLSLFFKQKII
jgi:hypothetical protein